MAGAVKDDGLVVYLVYCADDPTELWVQARDAGEAGEIAHAYYRWKHDGRYPNSLRVHLGKRVQDIITLDSIPFANRAKR